MKVISNEAYNALIKELTDPYDDSEFKFNINKLLVLPSEAEVDEPGEGSWHVVYDHEDTDKTKYGYYRFSQSLANCSSEKLAKLFLQNLIKSITEEG